MGATGTTKATVFHKAGVGVRRMEAARWLAAVSLLLAIFLGIFLYMKSARALASLGLPVVVAAVLGFLYWVKAVGDKADAYGRRADDARPGAAAEEAVGELLADLPKDYFVLNDFVTKRGSIDHILVSPKGVLTVETKSHRGVVTTDGERLLRNGRSFGEDFIRLAWAQAFHVRDLLVHQGLPAHRPQPVLLFADADVRVKGKVKGVDVIGRKDLPAYLGGLQERMTVKNAEKIFASLKISSARLIV